MVRAQIKLLPLFLVIEPTEPSLPGVQQLESYQSTGLINLNVTSSSYLPIKMRLMD